MTNPHWITTQWASKIFSTDRYQKILRVGALDMMRIVILKFSQNFLSPVTCAIRSRSCPSGFESTSKLACKICNCSSVNVVRTRLALPCLVSTTNITVQLLSSLTYLYLHLSLRLFHLDQ